MDEFDESMEDCPVHGEYEGSYCEPCLIELAPSITQVTIHHEIDWYRIGWNGIQIFHKEDCQACILGVPITKIWYETTTSVN